MTTIEKRQLKNDWSKQVEDLLQDIVDRHQPDDACKEAKADNPLFNTTCDYVDFRYEILQLEETLRLQRTMSERLIKIEVKRMQEQK